MIVDDDLGVRLLVQTVCEQAGIACCAAERGEDALALFERERPDVVVLDVMMPRVDGFEACRRIRAVDEDVPVLFLSAKGDVVDKRTGFAQGADDYLVKPFDEDELLVRMQALVRRAARVRERMEAASHAGAGLADGVAPAPARTCLEVGPFSINAVRHEVLKEGRAVLLAPKEFQLLLFLAQHAGDVIGKDEIVAAVWGDEYVHDAISVAVHVRKMREKLEDDPAHPVYLRTVRGVGYVFDA